MAKPVTGRGRVSDARHQARWRYTKVMQTTEWRKTLEMAMEAAVEWIDSLPQRPVRPERTYREMYEQFSRPMPESGEAAAEVISDLAARVPSGLMAMNSGRFYGWVIGGTQPAGLAADWLVAAWDQNTAMAESTPAVSAIEHVTANWILELLGLPPTSSVAFITGAQTANLVCLAAARSKVLDDAGWDVEADGLAGGPPVTVVVGEHRHHTIDKALRILGLGSARLRVVDANGPMLDATALAEMMETIEGPTIVCAQVGEVNTGAIDPIAEILEVVEGRAWLHVDGAFGMWARLDDRVAELLVGIERADSWATDAHKWLNTPYDCGIAITRHPDSHRKAMTLRADYLPADDTEWLRSPIDWNPEMSRRSRAVPVYATLAALGRQGVADMVRNCRDMAMLIAAGIGTIDGATILEAVVTNQVLIRFDGPDPEHTSRVLARVQQEGTCYPTGTMWGGRPAIRISVTHWATDESDVDLTVAALSEAHRAELARVPDVLL